MMTEFLNIIKPHIKWIFSGIGVFILSIIIYLLRRKSSSGDIIHTKGNQSPGKVQGNYTVIENGEKDN
jgi:hypothetical protein